MRRLFAYGLVALFVGCGFFGCGPTVVVTPAQGDVVMRVRVTPDIPPAEETGDPMCAGPGPDGLAIVDLANSDGHACLVLSNGTVRCWGANTSSQLGDGTVGRSATPMYVQGLPEASEVGVGQQASCALTTSGRVYCWGGNSWHELGVRTDGSLSRTPREVGGLRRVAHIGVGARHACAVTQRGQVWCWGRNTAGQVGSGNRDRHPTPQRVARIDATSVAAGNDSTCAVTNDAGVACWGALTASPRPVVVQGLPTAAVSVEVGHASACARLADGSVWCWGDGTHGQLGPGERGHSETPVRVDGLRPAMTLSVHATFACIVDDQHQTWCWGAREPFDVEASSPRLIGYMGLTAAVAVGSRAACARLEEGGLCCWGSNVDGIVGAAHRPFSNPGPIAEIPVPMLW